MVSEVGVRQLSESAELIADRFSQMQSAALSPLQMVKSFLQTSEPEKSGESNPELEEMRKRISELEARQQKSRTKPGSAKKRASKKAKK